MSKRYELHDILVGVLGSNNVYFQPPETIKLKYPCIIYVLDNVVVTRGDDSVYKKDRSYSLTYISNDPDNDIIDKLLDLQYCSFDRRFVSDNLYHDVFTIYY